MSVVVANGWCRTSFAVLATSFTLSVASANPAPITPPMPAMSLSGAGIQVTLQTKPGIDDGMRMFYAQRNYRPVWVNRTGLNLSAQQAIRALKRADLWGLDSEDFAIPDLETPMIEGLWSPNQVAQIDLAVSEAILAYARQARGARIPDPTKQLASYIDRVPDLPDGKEVLSAVSRSADASAALVAFHPQHEQFQRLQKLYAKAIAGDTDGEAQIKIPTRGPMLAKGRQHPDVVALRARLGVPVPAASADLFDDAVLAAVKQFQRKMGLRADGLVGPATRRAFNGGEKPSSRLATIKATMEQWRWMPRSLGQRYIIVNIPEFKFAYVENGETVMEDRVIVGTDSTQTPLFSHKMSTIVLRPEWYMPDSIKLKKIMSARNRGRTLESMGYRVKRNGRQISSSRVRWGRANISAYTVYQPSGHSNALGLVKFLFPNKHAVYLHDTPQKSLFGASTRTFSHGCIRVKNPLQLAELLLSRDPNGHDADVNRIIRKGKDNIAFTLEETLPVHIVHMTAWVDDDGSVRYFKDTYGHEKRTTLALQGKWKKIDRGSDHLAKVDTSDLSGVSLSERPSRPRVVRGRDFPPPPYGATRIVQSPSSGGWFQPQYRRSSGGSVGDLIRQRFGN